MRWLSTLLLDLFKKGTREMRDGGKGDKPRPFSIGLEKFDKQFEDIFGKVKVRQSCEVCGKSDTWCVCKKDKDELPVIR